MKLLLALQLANIGKEEAVRIGTIAKTLAYEYEQGEITARELAPRLVAGGFLFPGMHLNINAFKYGHSSEDAEYMAGVMDKLIRDPNENAVGIVFTTPTCFIVPEPNVFALTPRFNYMKVVVNGERFSTSYPVL